MSVRIYVPATLTLLEQFVADGGVGPAPVPARAVTRWLRETWPEADEEECEYAALSAAADDSVLLLGNDDVPRRVVLAADVATVVEAEDSSRVEVLTAFGLELVRSIHVDTEHMVRGRAYDPDELGDLGWYAVQEIPDLLA